MTDIATSGLAQLERWRAIGFLVAGGLFVVFAILWGAFAFTDMASEAVQDVVGPAGWTFAFVGLLGVYSWLPEASGRLLRAGAVFAGLGCIGGVVTTIGNLATLSGVVGSLPAWFEGLQLLLLVGIIPGFLTYAVVVLRDVSDLRRFGLLLLTPAVIFAVNIVRVATLGSTTPVWSPFVLGAAQALALSAIGYTVYTAGAGTATAKRVSEPTTE